MTQGVPDNREWLSYREAQLLTGYGRTTLSNLVNSGAIFASKCGRAVRINRISLQDYMVAQAHERARNLPRSGRQGGSEDQE